MAQPEACIVHFSHPHPLTLNHPPQTQQPSSSSCSGCKLESLEWTYGCPPCSYFLHLSCAKMPPQIQHPVDQHNHILTLLPTPVYPPGIFTCTACAKQGSGFSYRCCAASCNLHLHITCASMPLTRGHPSHHHLLHLTFSPPYPNQSFSCDICENLGSNQWLYRCHSCEFDAHLSCALKKTVAPVSTPLQQPLMQSYSTLPAQSLRLKITSLLLNFHKLDLITQIKLTQCSVTKQIQWLLPPPVFKGCPASSRVLLLPTLTSMELGSLWVFKEMGRPTL